MGHTVSYTNPWLLAVEGARRRTSGILALLLAIAALVLSLVGGVAVYRRLPDLTTLLGGEIGVGLDRLLLYVCSLAPLYLVAIAGLAFEQRARPNERVSRLAAALGGVFAGIGGFAGALALAALFGVVRWGADLSPMSHRLAGMVLGAGLLGFQAGGEEVFFRGWLQPLLATRWGPWVGLAATSLLFGVAHAALGPISPVAVINDILAGAVFGLLALRTGGLLAPILAHWGWNWAEQAVMGLTPNPGVDPLGSLFDVDLAGPSLLSGGRDEMNGSIAASLALLILLALILAWRLRSKAPPN